MSTTQEYAFADWALAQLAGVLPGRAGDVLGLMMRTDKWKGFYDASTGTLQPKHEGGSFFDGAPFPLTSYDTGAMGAWFTWSAMGLYPVTPGLPEYRLGGPLFKRITLHLSPGFHHGETFVIEGLIHRFGHPCHG